jgi:hypothetical protein
MFTGSQNKPLIQKLAETLRACSIGETITYAQLSRSIDCPVQERFYLVLHALRRVNIETGANFKNIRTVGYQRQPSSMAHVIGKEARAKGRRVFSRASNAITNTLDKANDITNEERLKAFREQVSLGLLQHMARDRNLPTVSEETPPPQLDATVKASVRMLREHLTAVYG